MEKQHLFSISDTLLYLPDIVNFYHTSLPDFYHTEQTNRFQK